MLDVLEVFECLNECTYVIEDLAALLEVDRQNRLCTTINTQAYKGGQLDTYYTTHKRTRRHRNIPDSKDPSIVYLFTAHGNPWIVQSFLARTTCLWVCISIYARTYNYYLFFYFTYIVSLWYLVESVHLIAALVLTRATVTTELQSPHTEHTRKSDGWFAAESVEA